MVTVDLSAIEAFARSLDPLRVKKASSMRQALPLMFDDFEQEVNFWALNSLLNFGSGWHQIRSERVRSKSCLTTALLLLDYCFTTALLMLYYTFRLAPDPI